MPEFFCPPGEVKRTSACIPNSICTNLLEPYIVEEKSLTISLATKYKLYVTKFIPLKTSFECESNVFKIHILRGEKGKDNSVINTSWQTSPYFSFSRIIMQFSCTNVICKTSSQCGLAIDSSQIRFSWKSINPSIKHVLKGSAIDKSRVSKQ
jgi:hypothetical protein